MNDEPSSSASAAAYPSDDTEQDGLALPGKAPTPAEMAQRRKKNRENFNRRRVELLDDLLRSIDILVYAELSAVYYMDNSFVRFFLRAIVQLMFLTPKLPMLPVPSGDRPYVGAIFGANILCILMHTILGPPSAGEGTRGYLHGGLAMDFIGQKGPTSRVHLVLLDALVLVLQIVQLSVHILRQKLKEAPATPIAVTTTRGGQYSAAPVSDGQTMDDEERGVRRSHEEDIEMQNLTTSGAATDSTDSTENAEEAAPSSDESLLASTGMPQHTDAHIFDAFNSGQIVIADLDVAKTVREQFWAYQKAPRDTNSVEATRRMRERLAQRVLRWRFESPADGRTGG